MVFRAVQANPEWTLLRLLEDLEARGPAKLLLESVRVHELVGFAVEASKLGLDWRAEQARQAKGPRFDALIHELLVEARGAVGPSYLLTRVGCSRWKLRGSLARLLEAGLVIRAGAGRGSVYQTRT